MSRFFARWSKSRPNRRRNQTSTPLGFDRLESREMLDGAMGPIALDGVDYDQPFQSAAYEEVVTAQGIGMLPPSLAANEIVFNNSKYFYLPLPTDNPGGGAQTFQVTSDDPNVTAEVLTGGRSIRMTVTIDPDGAAVTGVLTFRLFEDIAPIATSKIIERAQSGFYVGKTFYRVDDGFVAQGGANAPSDDTFDDEFSPLATFTGIGQLAMANSGDDVNGTEFFITDIDLVLGVTGPSTFLPQHLNFNHTIFGQMTAGFGFFNTLMTTPTTVGTTPDVPIVIDNVEVFTDNENGLVRLFAPAGYTTPVGDPAIVTVTVTDSANTTTMQAFEVTVTPDLNNDRPFLLPSGPFNTMINTPVTFTLPAIDIDGTNPTFSYVGANDNVTVDLNPVTGQVTVTPKGGFIGSVELTFQVTDAGGIGDPSAPLIDTQKYVVNVGGLTVDGGILTIDSAKSVLMGASYIGKDAVFGNEIGYFVADADGSVDGVKPGDPTYTLTALSSARRRTLFNSTEGVGAAAIPVFQPGEKVIFYLVQNGSAEDALLANPFNNSSGPNNVFFSLAAANPDGVEHVRITEVVQGAAFELAFEDLFGGGDNDFNDAVIRLQVSDAVDASDSNFLQVPANGPQTVTFTLLGRNADAVSEFGIYRVDDATGRIVTGSGIFASSISPGNLSYAAAAIGGPTAQSLFNSDSAIGSTASVVVPASSRIGFFIVVNGTRMDFLASNGDNISERPPQAILSFPNANVNRFDAVDQFGQSVFFFEDGIGGGDRDFDDYIIRVNVGP